MNLSTLLFTPNLVTLTPAWFLGIPVESFGGREVIPPIFTEHEALGNYAGHRDEFRGWDHQLDQKSENDPSISRVIRLPCDGCDDPENRKTDLMIEFNIPQGEHKSMFLNNIPILPTGFDEQIMDAQRAVNGTDPTSPPNFSPPPVDKPLVVVQMPSDQNSLAYVLRPQSFRKVKLNHSRTVSEKENALTGGKTFVIGLEILKVDGVKVALKGIEMMVDEDADGKLSFGPYKAIPKSEACGLDIKCIVDKMLYRMRNMRLPLPSLPSMGCHEEATDVEEIPEIPEMEDLEESEKAAVTTPPVFLHAAQSDASPERPTLFHRIVRQILLPVFVGIAVGMAVSLFGLIVGHIFVAVWRRYHSRRSSRIFGFGRRIRIAEGDDGKSLLPNGAEAPPAYGDEEQALDAIEKE
jgi:hypothetical protein